MKQYKKWSMVLAAQAFFGVGEMTAQDIYGGQLDSVVVQVAYGSSKKSALTGAVSQVGQDKIAKRPTSDALAGLEGYLPGVYVANNGGGPGEMPKIYVRGYSTVNGANLSAPLFIIDGVTLGDNTVDLNPDDIESISILKDAAAAALYGNRAANGVVLITTKRGKGAKMKFDLKMTQGSYSRAIGDYKTLDAKRFMEASWLSLRNSYLTSQTGADEAAANAYASSHLISDELKLNIFNKQADELFDANGKLAGDAQVLAGYADDLDWIDQGTRTGYRQTYNFSGSQATSVSDCYFSVGNLNEKGYLPNQGYERFTGRLNVNARPADWIQTGLSLSGSYQDKDMINTGEQSLNNVFRVGRYIAPIYPVHVHNADGSYVRDGNGNKVYDTGIYVYPNGDVFESRTQYSGRNPIGENELNTRNMKRHTLQGIAYADFKFLSDFTFTVKGDLNIRHSDYNYYFNSKMGSEVSVNGRLQRYSYNYRTYSFQKQLRWNHTYGDHTVDVLLGHENYQYKQEVNLMQKSNGSVFGSTSMSDFSTMEQMTGSHNTHRLESYLGRVRYNYKNRYNLEGNLRRDGSSRFAKGHRWGTFGSVGANWVASEEAFMKPVEWVNSLMLRGDYGVVGNDASVGYNEYAATYFIMTNGGQPAYIIRQLGNDELKWEKGQSFGFALDARLFDRWNLSMEYFDKRNKDLLFSVYKPISAGGTGGYKDFASSVKKNIGSVANRGFEVSTDVDIYRDKDWKVNFATNASFISNKVTKLPEANKEGIMENSYQKVVEGKSRFEFFTYTYAGVDQMTGKALYKADLDNYKVTDADGAYVAGNADGTDITKEVVCIGGQYYVNKVAHALKEFHGSALPKVYGSFAPSVTYKSFTFSALFTYQLGGKVYDNVYKELMSSSTTPHSYHADIAKSWNGVPEGMTEDSPNRIWKDGVPQINSYTSDDNNAVSSRWLVSSNFICLKNVYMSYDLPKQWVSKLSLDGVQVNLSCENLFIGTKRKGLDPQQSINGYHTSLATMPRVFTVGLNVKL